MDLTVTNVWPVLLPLPALEYTGAPSVTNLHSDPLFAKLARRRRFRPAYQVLQLKWVFGPAEYLEFTEFYITDLYNGTASFAIELLYPKNSNLTNWQVRFLGRYDASYNDGKWQVNAAVCLLQPITIVEPRDTIALESGVSGLGSGASEEGYIQIEYEGISCDTGIPSSFSSSYVWAPFFPEDIDPNDAISAEYRSYYRQLFINERDINLEGLTIHNYGPIYWHFVSTSSTKFQALNKVSIGNVDPEDPEGQWSVLFSSYWTLQQDFCFS